MQRQAVIDYMNQLHFLPIEGELQGRPCDFYFGYFADKENLFETFAPLAQEVIAELLKDMTVMAHFYPIQQTPSAPKSDMKAFSNFFAQVQSVTDEEPATRVFGDVSDDTTTLFRCTQGVDTALLHQFNHSPISYSHENYLYGFCKMSQISSFHCTELAQLLNTNTHDILCSYHRFHVGLDLQINSSAISQERVRQTILEVCNKHKKVCSFEN